MKHKWISLALDLLTLLTISSCASVTVPLPTSTFSPAPVSPTFTPPPTPAPPTSTPPPPTGTAAPSITPTFAILRGTVLELSSCRYGPGAPYLYFTGLVPGSNLEVIGRREDSQWIYVEAIGGHSPCWVKASLMSVQGDINRVEVYYPDKAPLPKSPYYPPTTVTKATRNGNQITVMWLDIPLRAGDEEDANMLHYIVEVWHCVGGQIVFDPLATNDTSITFVDEPACNQPSHGRIFVQEKHGFAGPAEIPWPPFSESTPSSP
jgi:uncharacterized protein YraI